MKKERNRSNWNEFLMSLAATTVSIILTFGTTAIVNRHTRNAEKREMVMMIMYDMRETLVKMESCDKDLNAFFDLQVELVSQPQQYKARSLELTTFFPMFNYMTTTESIFKSNIETIKTIGNILFVETVSSFYDDRAYYKTSVVDAFLGQAGDAIKSYEDLAAFNSALYPFYSQTCLDKMRGEYEQCKLMMKVTDKDLEGFRTQRQKLQEVARKSGETEGKGVYLDELKQRNEQLHQAREAGKNGLNN